MNKFLLILILILVPNLVLAEVRISLTFPKSQIKQGELEEVDISMDFSSTQNFEIQKLKDTTPGDILYFHKISPLMRSDSSGTLTGRASVVFINVPETSFVRFKDQEQTVVLTWNNIEITPTESRPVFIYEDFTIPGREVFNSTLLISGVIILLLIPVFVFVYLRYKKIRDIKLEKRLLKDNLLSANSYEEVVELWKDKSRFIKEFPSSETAFRRLEEVLFRYQFKPSQDDSEKSEVMKAYRDFSDQMRENLDGI